MFYFSFNFFYLKKMPCRTYFLECFTCEIGRWGAHDVYLDAKQTYALRSIAVLRVSCHKYWEKEIKIEFKPKG